MVALTKACNIIQNLIDNKKVIDAESIAFPIEFSKLTEANKMEKMILTNKDQLSKNYELIRLDNVLFSHKFVITDYLLNYNSRSEGIRYFMELNSKIFSQFPLQIEMLLKGEKI